MLDSDLLPIYLDVLQVLKANCPVLVEHMVHSSISLVGGEAFSLLLKRPWNPVVGMHSVDKQVPVHVRVGRWGRGMLCNGHSKLDPVFFVVYIVRS